MWHFDQDHMSMQHCVHSKAQHSTQCLLWYRILAPPGLQACNNFEHQDAIAAKPQQHQSMFGPLPDLDGKPMSLKLALSL